MSYSFTARDLANVERALTRLTQWPRSADAWAADACIAIRDLVGGDYSMLSQQTRSEHRYHSPDTPADIRAAVEQIVPKMTVETPADPSIAGLLALERAGAFDTWSAGSLDALLDGQFTRGAMFREVVEPAGMCDVVGITSLAGDRVSRIAVGFVRAEDRDERSIALMRLVRPAFDAGIAIGQRLAATRDGLLAAFDIAGDGVLLLARGGREIYRSRLLERLLAADPERARIEAAARRIGETVAALHHTKRRDVRDVLAGSPLTVPVSTRRAVYTLRGGALPAEIPGLPDAVALVHVRAPQAALLDVDTVRARFGIPQRVAEVAILLAERRSNAEIAARLGISTHTARRHTERVLAALGVASRTQVAAALYAATIELPRAAILRSEPSSPG